MKESEAKEKVCPFLGTYQGKPIFPWESDTHHSRCVGHECMFWEPKNDKEGYCGFWKTMMLAVKR